MKVTCVVYSTPSMAMVEINVPEGSDWSETRSRAQEIAFRMTKDGVLKFKPLPDERTHLAIVVPTEKVHQVMKDLGQPLQA